MTIVEAIKQVLQEAGTPLTAQEIYDLITTKKLYTFKAKNPQSVVSSQIRKHCAGTDQPKNTAVKHFEEAGKGKFKALQDYE